MIKAGRYAVPPFNYGQYIAPYFVHNPGLAYKASTRSCGEYAVMALTGKPYTPEEEKKYKKVLSRSAMVRLLQSRGYTVHELSILEVASNKWCDNFINTQHVLLTCQMYMKNNASWSISHKGEYYHMGTWDKNIYPIEFITRPILASYIIFHSQWAVEPILDPVTHRCDCELCRASRVFQIHS